MKKILISALIVIGIAGLTFALLSVKNNASVSSNAKANSVKALKALQPSPAAQSAPRYSAPDFSLPKLGGGTIRLSDYRGKKPVVVDFWTSWCPNCSRDMPKLNKYYELYKDRVEVIGVNLQESESDVQNFITSKGISFPIALDAYGQTAQSYGVNYTNFHVLIDKDGEIRKMVPGDISESDILSLIQ